MRTSPHVAVVTSFWPDHLELHGSLDAYRQAKEQIVRAQTSDDHLVVNADDPQALAFADHAAATVHLFSARRVVERGVYVAFGRIRAGQDGAVDLGPEIPGPRGRAALAAAAAVVASGVAAHDLVGLLELLEQPPGRARVVGRVGPTALVDDGMAATPAKTQATLRQYGADELVLVSGGELGFAGREVHASAEEQAELEATFDEIERVARLVVCFGPAGKRVAEGLSARQVRVERVDSLADAIAVARERTADAAALLVSPMYPVGLDDRSRIARLLSS